jgi:ABC-2 type transport system permease protein
LALAVRLHRGAVLGWAVGIVSLGFFYGVVADQAEQMVDDNPDMADFLTGLAGGSISDAFLATGLLVVGLLTAGSWSPLCCGCAPRRAAAGSTVARDSVSRARWAAGHLAVSLVAMVLLMSAGGMAEGVGAALAMADADASVS